MESEEIMKRVLIFVTGLLIFFLEGCANIGTKHIPLQENTEPRKLAVFFDGTANEEGSRTNIAKLHNLVTLQYKTNISTIYIEGVGTGIKFIGMAMGWGIGEDVREAYLYLAENFNLEQENKKEIYIFGFSRGAYAARILAALLHVAGIPERNSFLKKSGNERKRYIEEIYAAYKMDGKSIAIRRKKVQKVMEGNGGIEPKSVKVKFMGLWDTIEALALPDLKEDFLRPNENYADQLCNVENAAHAVSIDDNRARIFTPILLTRKHLIEKCEKKESNIDIKKIKTALNKKVNEVWFSGAHADVGGGYQNSDTSGVSLNWMIQEMSRVELSLIPMDSKVYADPCGETHDPEKGLYGLIYYKKNRNLKAYSDKSPYNKSKLKIHQSVLDRLSKLPVKQHEFQWKKTYNVNGKKCFKETTDQCFQSKLNIEKKEGCLKLLKGKCDDLFEIVSPNYKDKNKKTCTINPHNKGT